MHFIKTKKIWYTISILVLLVGFYSIFTKGFNVGADFLGGSSMILRFQNKSVNINQVRAVAQDNNFVITKVAEDVFIKSKVMDEKQKSDFLAKLEKGLGRVEVLEFDTVGPSVGKQLQQQSIWIIGLAIVLILIYITIRFEFSYALAGIVAELHDALFMLGFCSMMGLEINITTVVAILTILGYSINDTIVVFDRIREEIANNKDHKKDLADIANESIHITLTRSINTSVTTLLAVMALYFFGGVTIRDFALLLLAGIVDGVYSSIFIASPLMIGFKKLQG